MRFLPLLFSRWTLVLSLFGLAAGFAAPTLWIEYQRGPALDIAMGDSREAVRERLGHADYRGAIPRDGRGDDIVEAWWYFWPDSKLRRALDRVPLTGDHPAFERKGMAYPMAVFWFDSKGRVATISTPR